MRAFLALPVPDAVRTAAARLQEELRRAGADVGWTRPEQMHLTIKFLGEIEPAAAARFAERLTASLPRRPVELEYAGLLRETRPFSPHLTLGRIRSPRHLKALEAAMEARADVVLGRGAASELILYESTLGAQGAVHEPLRRFPLRPPTEA